MSRDVFRPRRSRWWLLGAAGVVLTAAGVVAWTAHGDSDPAAEAGSAVTIVTAAGVELVDGAMMPPGAFSPFTVQAAGDISEVACVLDGTSTGTVRTPPYRFETAPPGPGDHRLRCTVTHHTGPGTVVRLRFASGSAPLTSRPGTTPDPAVPGSTPEVTAGTVVVGDARTLQDALRTAGPGTTIVLQDGAYRGTEVRDPSGDEPGRFVASTSGTADAPITLRGSAAAVLDGGGTRGGYALHLTGADHWRLEGFTVSSASKGIVLDGSDHNVIDGVHVTDIGDEGIHFRSSSSDNVLRHSTVDHTGVDSPQFGEGVYVGSATSNWEKYSGGEPDRSDRNQILDNVIVDTAAENIDIKEGSSDGVVRGNRFGGDRVAGENSADSWIDVKGNGYLIDGNHGHTTPRPGTTECGDPDGDPTSALNPFCEGFQVHVALDGWGRGNTFTGNRLEVNAPGAGIWLQNTAVDAGNVIACSNTVSGAAAGDYATNHYQLLPCTP